MKLPVAPELPLDSFVQSLRFCPTGLELVNVLVDGLVDPVHGELAARGERAWPLDVIQPVGEQHRDIGRDGLNVGLVIEWRYLLEYDQSLRSGEECNQRTCDSYISWKMFHTSWCGTPLCTTIRGAQPWGNRPLWVSAKRTNNDATCRVGNALSEG